MKLSHPVITLALAVLLWPFGLAWLGALLGAVGFAFREVTQAEYRWIERFGKRFQTSAEYAEWHFHTYGQAEGRQSLGSWDEYFSANPDLQAEWANLAGSRSRMPWWGGFDPRVWDRHSLLGCALPALVALLVLLCRAF